MDEPRSILVLLLRRLGDVILATPALQALKDRYPTARLHVLVEEPGAQALHGHPAIDEILIYDAPNTISSFKWIRLMRNRRFDWVIDFLATPRTALITLLSGAKIKAGPAHVSRRWAYNHLLQQSPETCYAALEKIRWISSLGVTPPSTDPLPRVFLTHKISPQNVIGLIPASRKETHRWPAGSFAKLGRLLRQRHLSQIRIFWGPGEQALANDVASGIGPGADIAPQTKTIADLAGELAKCKLIITNCAGPKHLAVALGIPTLTIHGPSDPRAWTPKHPDHSTVRLEELECIGCRLKACKHHLECMRLLPPESVLTAAETLLSRTPAVI